jgi:hypothetical protein
VTITIPVSVGTSNAGVALEAMLVDAAGVAQAGWPLTTGFAMAGSIGTWTGVIPDGWRGALHVRKQSDHSVLMVYGLDPGDTTPASGGGARAVTVTARDGGGTLVPNALVRLSAGAESFIAYTGAAGASLGIASFSVNNGVWTRSITAAGLSFTPDTINVTGNGDFPAVLSANTIPAPPSPSQSTGVLVTCDAQGNRKGNVSVTFTLIRLDGTAGQLLVGDPFTLTSNGSGDLSGPFAIGKMYKGSNGVGREQDFLVPNAANFNIPAILGLSA